MEAYLPHAPPPPWSIVFVSPSRQCSGKFIFIRLGKCYFATETTIYRYICHIKTWEALSVMLINVNEFRLFVASTMGC